MNKLAYLAAAATICTAALPAAAAELITGATTVQGNSATGAVVYSGAVAATDTLKFRVGGEVFLQNNGGNPRQYGTNAAGVLTTGSTNTSYPNTPGGFFTYTSGGQTFTYGALLASFTSGGTTQTVQLFATNAASGVGSSAPPSDFTYFGTLGDLFTVAPGSAGTLTFVAADTGFDDNAGSFGVTAVPEPATWAMMVIGFAMVGFGLRSRRRTVARGNVLA